jgi:hypothetical protein
MVGVESVAQEDPAAEGDTSFPISFYGFLEARGGVRTQEDGAQSKDATLGELRLQLQTEKSLGNALIEFTGDFVLDGVEEEGDFDLRQLRLTWSPVQSMDVRIGRQVMTWGTGDMLFINDLFPKDWVSFFVGRDVEYLKAPSDAVRVGWFSDFVNVDFVYTPRFEPDRFITGRRISFWDPSRRDHSGADNRSHTDVPDDWFEEDEFALRLYKDIGSSEVALYGYTGYWKSPAGSDPVSMDAIFPRLRVYGTSIRGTLGTGVAHAELGYYDSRDDSRGSNPLVNNSEFRFLLGYERELGKEFTGAVQYYVEWMMDYEDYRDTLPIGMSARDEDRHVFTVRLTKMLMNQNLILSFFAYVSPSDEDAFLRPKATYKVNDAWTLEGGANVFLGDEDTTFFGQFDANTNVYGSMRLSF